MQALQTMGLGRSMPVALLRKSILERLARVGRIRSCRLAEASDQSRILLAASGFNSTGNVHSPAFSLLDHAAHVVRIESTGNDERGFDPCTEFHQGTVVE